MNNLFDIFGLLRRPTKLSGIPKRPCYQVTEEPLFKKVEVRGTEIWADGKLIGQNAKIHDNNRLTYIQVSDNKYTNGQEREMHYFLNNKK